MILYSIKAVMLLGRKDLRILRLYSPQEAAKKWLKLTSHTVKVKKREELDNFEEISVNNKRKTHELKLFSFWYVLHKNEIYLLRTVTVESSRWSQYWGLANQLDICCHFDHLLQNSCMLWCHIYLPHFQEWSCPGIWISLQKGPPAPAKAHLGRPSCPLRPSFHFHPEIGRFPSPLTTISLLLVPVDQPVFSSIGQAALGWMK